MPPVRTLLRPRLLILGWLLTWITTAPLFHSHIPDTTDPWSALESGGAHTVFTPDLPGEYSHLFHGSAQEHSSHLSHRTVFSPELGVVLFEEDRRAKAYSVPHAPCRFGAIPLSYSSVLELPRESRNCHIFTAFPALRAPPLMFFFS